MSPQVPADFLFLLHRHPETHSTCFTLCPVCHHTHILWVFSPHRFYLVHWCQPHRPILSGGIDTLRTVFTCLLYSLEAIKPRGFLFSRSCFVYRVFTAVTQDLLSHLSKNYLLNEYFAKYLCLYAQDAHARPLI